MCEIPISVIQIYRVFRVFLDELLAGLNLFSHKDGEGLVRLHGVFQRDSAQRALLRVHGGLPQLVGVHFAKALVPGNVDLHVLGVAPHLGGNAVTLRIGVGHSLLFAAGQLVQRRYGGVYVALLDERAHEPEEEGQKQRADMGAVHIGIGHDDYFVVAQLVEIELLAYAGAQRHDDGVQLVVAVHLVRPGLFHVKHLAPQWQDGLKAGVASLGGGAACGIALDDIQLCERRVALVAVPELVGHLAGFQSGLAPDGFTGLACRLAGAVGREGLVQDGPAHGRILLKKLLQLVGHDGVHQRAHLGVAQLGLGLALELGVGELNGNDGGETFAAILAGEAVALLEGSDLLAVGVEHTGQRGLEAGFVHAALGGVDVVGKREDGLIIAGVILQGDLRHGVLPLAGHVDDIIVQGVLVPVDPGHKFPDSARIAHLVFLLLAGAVVDGADFQACI